MNEKKPVRKKTVRRWVIPTAILLVVLTFVGGAFYFYTAKRNNAIPFNSRVGQIRNLQPSMPGGAGTPEYNNTLYKNETEKAQRAEETGRSRISTVVGKEEVEQLIADTLKPEPEPPKPEPKTQAVPVTTPPPAVDTKAQAARQRKEDQAYLAELDALRKALNKSVLDEMVMVNKTLKGNRPVQKLTIFDDVDLEKLKEDRNPIIEVSNQGPQKDIKLTPFEVGEVLYGINDIAVNSDVPGPVKIQLVSGPYKGGVFIGNFKRHDAMLLLEFDTFSFEQQIYRIKGYAVDPQTRGVAVRSDVDHHRLSRWGGLIAASFLEGFADAIENSGLETYGNAWGSYTKYPKYSFEDQMWIAAGRVGEHMAVPMYQNFYRSPTVTLNSGEGIGILIIGN